jgi:hypothetical protein
VNRLTSAPAAVRWPNSFFLRQLGIILPQTSFGRREPQHCKNILASGRWMRCDIELRNLTIGGWCMPTCIYGKAYMLWLDVLGN